MPTLGNTTTEPISAVPARAHNADGRNHCGPSCVRPAPSQAHCAARGCGITFASVGGFDRHRKDGRCIDPAMLGMAPNDAGVWRTPMAEDIKAKLYGTGSEAA